MTDKRPATDVNTKFLVIHRVWRGQAGWKPGKLGEPIHDLVHHFFPTRANAEAFMRKKFSHGCDCCPDLLEQIELGIWYECGSYGDEVMVRKPILPPLDSDWD